MLRDKREYDTDEWLLLIKTIQNTESLKELTEVLGEPMGFSKAIAYSIPAIGSKERQNASRLFYYKMPKEITSHMKAKYSRKLDPVAQYVLDFGKAVWISDIVDQPSFAGSGCDKFVKGIVSLVGDGICVPTFYKTSWAYYFVNFGKPKAEFNESFLWQVQSLCQHSHVQYVQLTKLLKEKVKLTDREHGVIELIAMGKSNCEIATILGIATHTVNGYVRSIYLKLDVNDRVTAALRAMSLNLVS